MEPIFASGATLDGSGQVVATVDAIPPETPDTPAAEPGAPPASPSDAEAEAPSPDAEPAPSDEEAAVADAAPRTTRPFVARLIRENERIKRDLAAQAAHIEYLTRQGQPPPGQTPAPPAGQAPAPSSGTPRPRMEDFTTQVEYLDALTDWKLDEREHLRHVQAVQAREASQRQTAQQQWAQRESEGRDKYEDYDEVVSRLSLLETIAPIVADTFRESTSGHDLLYYLGQHPGDVQQLNGLLPLAAARWLGQLEGRLGAPVPPARPPVRPAGTRPPATTPMQPVGAGGSGAPVGFRQGMSLADYERMRLHERGQRP
jgi:hypothetical protein